jgi:hypothetical protein
MLVATMLIAAMLNNEPAVVLAVAAAFLVIFADMARAVRDCPTDRFWPTLGE